MQQPGFQQTTLVPHLGLVAGGESPAQIPPHGHERRQLGGLNHPGKVGGCNTHREIPSLKFQYPHLKPHTGRRRKGKKKP